MYLVSANEHEWRLTNVKDSHVSWQGASPHFLLKGLFVTQRSLNKRERTINAREEQGRSGPLNGSEGPAATVDDVDRGQGCAI